MGQNDFLLKDILPKSVKDALTLSGESFIEIIGIDIAKEVIKRVFLGENLRDSTEMVTKKRIATLSNGLIIFLLTASKNDPNYFNKLVDKAVKNLKKRNIGKIEKWISYWILGLTEKGFQNILRDNPENLDSYKDKFLQVQEEALEETINNYGKLTGILNLGNSTNDNKIQDTYEIDWRFFIYLCNIIGSGTLTLRGSAKSAYGKLFEKLILGALLEILGFIFVKEGELNNLNQVFWLSSTSKRESDATLILAPGKGIRFDIGFIGRGNPEITLDKVSRFEKEIQFGSKKYYMGTIIIVDRIGERSKIEELATKIDGTIIQMSHSYWPRLVAETLKNHFNYETEILNSNDDEFEEFIQKKLETVDLTKFLPFL